MTEMTSIKDIEPGDIFVTVPTSSVFRWIELGESLIDHRLIKERKAQGKPVWGHAGIASRRVGSTLMIVQAEPRGAVEVPWGASSHENEVHLWSTGILPPCPAAGWAAMKYAGYDRGLNGTDWLKVSDGVPYSFLDYEAIALHSWHVNFGWLRDYIKSTGHMICSQLADQCRADGGSHLFNDGRWPGYVTPLDLGLLLEGVQ